MEIFYQCLLIKAIVKTFEEIEIERLYRSINHIPKLWKQILLNWGCEEPHVCEKALPQKQPIPNSNQTAHWMVSVSLSS